MTRKKLSVERAQVLLADQLHLIANAVAIGNFDEVGKLFFGTKRYRQLRKAVEKYITIEHN